MTKSHPDQELILVGLKPGDVVDMRVTRVGEDEDVHIQPFIFSLEMQHGVFEAKVLAVFNEDRIIR